MADSEGDSATTAKNISAIPDKDSSVLENKSRKIKRITGE
jgi:hypothetical protein